MVLNIYLTQGFAFRQPLPTMAAKLFRLCKEKENTHSSVFSYTFTTFLKTFVNTYVLVELYVVATTEMGTKGISSSFSLNINEPEC